MVKPVGKYDVAVIGGNTIALALAYWAARQGYRVIIFDRNPLPHKGLERNLGLISPIAEGKRTLDQALRSRKVWLELGELANFWVAQAGSLHLAYNEQELVVLEEFLATTPHLPYQCELLTPSETVYTANGLNPIRLEGALYSNTELIIDPLEAIPKLHQFLQNELGVVIRQQTVVSTIHNNLLSNGQEHWEAGQVFICTSTDYKALFPNSFLQHNLKEQLVHLLQIDLKTQKSTLGPSLFAAPSHLYMDSFTHCESLDLMKSKAYKDHPAMEQWGIQLKVSKTRNNQLLIGQSHEAPHSSIAFDKQKAQELLLKLFGKIYKSSGTQVVQNYHHRLCKMNPDHELVTKIDKHIAVICGENPSAMTLAFGLAEDVLAAPTGMAPIPFITET